MKHVADTLRIAACRQLLILSSGTIESAIVNAAAKYATLIESLDDAPGGRLFVSEWHDDDDQRSVTFGEFRTLARKYAASLKQQGVRSGDRVIFIMPQGIALMAAFAGSMMLAAVPAILAYPNSKSDPAKYNFGLRGITANLRAPYIFVDQDFPEALTAEMSASRLTKIIRLPQSLEHLNESVPDASTLHPGDIAFIQHSAGTTGLQKGVALSHFAVLTQLTHLIEALHINESDRIYSWLPLYHDMGLIACFILPMVLHLPVIMQSPSEWVLRPETMLNLIHHHRCTLAWLPNFAFQFVPRRTSPGTRAGLDLTCLRALVSCSEPVKTESMDEFHHAFAASGLKRSALQSSYAMAENVFAVTQSHANGPLQLFADGARFRAEHIIEQVSPDLPGAVPFTSSGRLLPQNQVRIVSDTGDELPALRVGEILIKSDSLFSGYFNRPDLTAEAMIDGWYRTGDLGFFYNEELFVVGRKKDLLIIGGENIYPQDVEEIVAAHPAIHDGRAVAFGLFNRGLGTEDLIVVAEVEREEALGKAADIEPEIRSSVLAQLSVAVRRLYLKPPKWIVKSTAGKPARSATREKLLREDPDLLERS